MTAEVIVVGAGPAGATAAAVLAQRGVRVLVLEKDVFPRFHIGESLLPRVVPILERLGVPGDATHFLHKAGAEFHDEPGGTHAVFPFATGLPGGPQSAFQVERAVFDQRLAEAAERAGAQVRFGVRVTAVECGSDGARVVTERDSWSCRYVIDATGQDGFLGRRDRTLAPIGQFGKAAVFTHFEAVGPALDELFGRDGNIKVLVMPHGWAWLIPLTRRRLSVGLVSQERGISAAWLDELLAQSPLLQRLTVGATRGATRILRNFSYKNTRPSGPRYACVGDAAAFLDPVFSSGVTLAMESGEHLALRLSEALALGTEADAELAAPVFSHLRVAYGAMASLIHQFYNGGLVRNIFFAQEPDPHLRAGLVSLLAGDLWRTDNRFQEMLLRSSRRQSAVADLGI
jgi:flavin-dependent dehydrogenase